MKAADRCPGVLRPHLAADGALVRLRLPGGRTSAATLSALSELAGRFGNSDLQLTSRAGIQLRGLPAVLPATLVTALDDLGLLPSYAHERVRNIAASPLTGTDGGLADLGPMITALDETIRADADLADLPGRFLFVLDDGRGDVTNLALDLGYRATSAEGGWLLLGDPQHGLPVVAEEVVPRLVGLARRFLAVRGSAWHVRELPAWVDSFAPIDPELPSGAAETPLGRLGAAASVLIPLGLLTTDQVAAVAAAQDGSLVVTPWRGLVLPTAAERLPDLVAAGLVADAGSGWSMVTACVGAPGCSSAHGRTRPVAEWLAATAHPERTHVSGCARRCGAPAGEFADLVLT